MYKPEFWKKITFRGSVTIEAVAEELFQSRYLPLLYSNHVDPTSKRRLINRLRYGLSLRVAEYPDSSGVSTDYLNSEWIATRYSSQLAAARYGGLFSISEYRDIEEILFDKTIQYEAGREYYNRRVVERVLNRWPTSSVGIRRFGNYSREGMRAEMQRNGLVEAPSATGRTVPQVTISINPGEVVSGSRWQTYTSNVTFNATPATSATMPSYVRVTNSTDRNGD